MSIGKPGNSRGVGSKELALPPQACTMFLFWRTEPVLPENSANDVGRLTGEGIAGEKPKHGRIILEKQFFSSWNDRILLPTAERGEPEVPVETRLVGGIDARTLVQLLRLVAEGISNPMLPIGGSLKLNLIAMRRHHGKQPILVRDAKRFEYGYGLCG